MAATISVPGCNGYQGLGPGAPRSAAPDVYALYMEQERMKLERRQLVVETSDYDVDDDKDDEESREVPPLVPDSPEG